jgi:hypothetical protein
MVDINELQDLILEALGQASMCWSEVPRGVFDDEKAKGIAGVLIYDIVKMIQPEEPMKEHKSYSQHSMSKHITLRAALGDLMTEDAIDMAVDKGLDIMSNKIGRTVHLINAIPAFRSDGVIFVTVIGAPTISEEFVKREVLELAE